MPLRSEGDRAALSLEKRVVNCFRCPILIGVIGAGMTNAVFMRPRSLLIEICHIGYALPPASFVEVLCRARKFSFERILSSPLDKDLSTTVAIDAVVPIIWRYQKKNTDFFTMA